MNRTSRILIHSIVFSPDSVSTAYLYTDIALGFQSHGYDVVVLTSTPHYNVLKGKLDRQPMKKRFFGLFFTSRVNGIKVYHVPLKKYKSVPVRILSFVYWHFISFCIGLFLKNIRYILSPSPPLTIGFVSWLIGVLKGARSIYNVQEIYPDLLINQGNIRSGMVIGLLKRLEQFIYNHSALTLTIDQIFYNTIVNRFKDTGKLKIIPNFVDTDLYHPTGIDKLDSRVFDTNPSAIRVLYAGNIGVVQDWEPVLYAARKLSGSDIEFWIIGEGVKKEWLQNAVAAEKLGNIRILAYQDRELMAQINAFGDIHFISMNPDMEQEGFPSKVYTIMACARPLIVISGRDTPLYQFLDGKGCAELITENRNEQFTDCILKLARDSGRRQQMGRAGLAIIEKEYSKEIVVGKYVDTIHLLA